MNERKKTNEFCPIAKLLLEGYPIGECATAIEEKGCYTYDSYGRFMRIHSQSDENKKKLKNKILNELSGLYEKYESDTEALENAIFSSTLLNNSGWISDKLPDFKTLQTEWNKKNSEREKPPEKSDPAPQTKVWDVLLALFKLKYGDDVTESSQLNKKMTKIISELSSKGISITDKTIKSYIKNH
jgi:hypothetical protein